MKRTISEISYRENLENIHVLEERTLLKEKIKDIDKENNIISFRSKDHDYLVYAYPTLKDRNEALEGVKLSKNLNVVVNDCFKNYFETTPYTRSLQEELKLLDLNFEKDTYLLTNLLESIGKTITIVIYSPLFIDPKIFKTFFLDVVKEVLTLKIEINSQEFLLEELFDVVQIPTFHRFLKVKNYMVYDPLEKHYLFSQASLSFYLYPNKELKNFEYYSIGEEGASEVLKGKDLAYLLTLIKTKLKSFKLKSTFERDSKTSDRSNENL